MAVSPDGKYALSQSHLFDIKSMKAVAELPFPSPHVGFLSTGENIYICDKVHLKAYILKLDDLLKKNGGPADG